MKGIMDRILEMVKKLGYLALQYFHTAVQWIVRFVKVQLQKLRRGGVQKDLQKAYSGLGSEIYALHKQGVDGWETMLSVQQHLKVSEAAEAEVFKVDGVIEEINNEYLRRREEIREYYTQKRADVGKSYGDESET